jgi:hypothetical protein
MAVDAPAIGAAAAGSVSLFAAIKGISVTAALTSIVRGQSPAALPNTEPIPGSTGTGPGTGATGTVSGGQGVAAGSNEATLKATAATFGWTDANGQWPALNSIELAEAGYNLTAQNPTSKAYGEAQFIDGASEYATYGGNATTAAGQAVAMCNYIKQRYGTPVMAWAFHLANGYY